MDFRPRHSQVKGLEGQGGAGPRLDRGVAERRPEGIADAAAGAEEGLLEAVIREGVEDGIDAAVGVAENGKTLEQVDLPRRHRIRLSDDEMQLKQKQQYHGNRTSCSSY